MAIFLPQIENIYFSKTKEYFEEVISSYSNKNYRSAIVMLYTVAIYDLLAKLQELKYMYNDSKAIHILNIVETEKNNSASKSSWEKQLVEKIYKKTDFLDDEAYVCLNNLYGHRNLSAHPALNGNFELIKPSQEMTIAYIKSTLINILIKPPIFISSIIDRLTDDLQATKELYQNNDEGLKVFLENKYFSRMQIQMKLSTVRTLWKFCFCSPEDSNCCNNLKINRKALEILILNIEKEVIDFIKSEENKFIVANNEKCVRNLIIFLSCYPKLFNCLNDETKLHIEHHMKTNDFSKSIAWFKSENLSEHLNFLKDDSSFELSKKSIECLKTQYRKNDSYNELIDFFVTFFGDSSLYDIANERFNLVIAPIIDDLNYKQFIKLLEVCNNNCQIYDRRNAKYTNGIIIKNAIKVLGDDFDFDQYENIRFSKTILENEKEGETESSNL